MSSDRNNAIFDEYELPQVPKLYLGPIPMKYKRHAVYTPSEWLLEIASSILSLSLTVGIACIFWHMDHKPLSDWRAPVSLSATISILTTGYSAALMHGVSQFIGQLKWLYFKTGPKKLSHFETFDAATRGIWGSIMLITTIKWNLATIGALITILRLTFAPFAQQVILLEQRDIGSPDSRVAFGYSHQYNRGLTREMANARFGSIPQDPDMQSAVVQALYGTNITAPFSCPGVCRWTGSYISLGFKSECKNVTQETLRSARCNGTQYSTQCNMTTPGGLVLPTRHLFTEYGTSYSMNATSMLSSFGKPLPDTFPEITRFAVYRSTPDHNFQPENINITDCSLSLTAYEYIDAKANGSDFSFGKTQEVNFGDGNPWKFTTDDGLSGYLYTNKSHGDTNSVPALEISYVDIISLENFFTSATIVTEWVDGNYANENLGLAAALTGDVDIGKRFKGMAASMTSYLHNGPNAQFALGEQVESVPFISIRWAYYIAPAITEAIAILFAVLTMISNRRSHNVPLWKSSALAVLDCQHNKQLRMLQSTVRDIQELQESAEKTAARLQ